MRNVFTLVQKELHSFFVSPIAYVVIAAFLASTGYLFAVILLVSREATLRPLFNNLGVIFLLLSPVLTMRLLADEQRTGTIELLLTSPVRDGEVVLGKFLASLLFLCGMLLPTGLYVLMLLVLDNPDRGPLVSGYLGILLLGGVFLSLGLLASSLTPNQIVAAVISFGGLLMLWLIDMGAQFIDPPVSEVLRYLSLANHFPDFNRGIVDTRDLIYYLSLTILFLFAATRVLESRRWR